MKKLHILTIGLIAVMGLSSCMKERDIFDSNAQFELEKPQIETYAKQHLNNPQHHEESGIWYEIISPGTADSYEYRYYNSQPELFSIKVNYVGRLLNGTQFDANEKPEGLKMPIQNWIRGWHVTFLPKTYTKGFEGADLANPVAFGGITEKGLQKGAKIRIVMPSYLGYGNNANGPIPANSPLDFEITVLDIERLSTSGN